MQALKTMIGAVAVYAFVACASAVEHTGASRVTEDAASTFADAVPDVLNPVPTATAGELSSFRFEGVDEPCTHPGTTHVGGATQMFAVHDFAGKSPDELAYVVVMAEWADGPTVDGVGGPGASAIGYTRRGTKVMVACGTLGISKARFVLPIFTP